MRRTLARLSAVLAILAVAWAGSGVGMAALLTTRRHAMVDEPPPCGFEPVRLRASDGLAIGAWVRRVERARAAVVMVHGNGSSRSALGAEARVLSDHGLTTMPITVRAHGDSEGWRNDIGWSARLDVIAAVEHLRGSDPEVKIIVHGRSLGAAAAIFAAPELRGRVAGYVLIAPYADLETAVERRTDRYLPPGVASLAYGALWLGARVVLPDIDAMAPARAAAHFPAGAQVLIVAGGADDRAPVSDARAIARAVPGSRVVVLEGFDHGEVAREAHRLGLALKVATAISPEPRTPADHE